MVSVRFASEIFGVETKDTLWDDASKTFTIFNNGKTIQFIGNADFYRVNGAEVHMTTNGVKIYSEIDPEAGRMYIPFRHSVSLILPLLTTQQQRQRNTMLP